MSIIFIEPAVEGGQIQKQKMYNLAKDSFNERRLSFVMVSAVPMFGKCIICANGFAV